MARNYAGLDLGFLFMAHSVGSEFWLKQWITISPWLTERDVLLSSTASSKEALLQISQRFQLARHIPLCIAMRSDIQSSILIGKKTGLHLFAISRLEDVKNVDLIIECFARLRWQIPDLHMTIAGEYTGNSDDQIQNYKQKINHLIIKYELENCISFPGPVEGEVKDELFRSADILINLSTDPGETFGFNLVEAKTWGLPVVCTNWDGFREVVTHGKDGFLIDCNWEQEQPTPDLEQAIHYCLRLLQDVTLYRGFSETAFSEALSYDYKRIFPLIAAALKDTSMHKVATTPDAGELALTKLSDLSRLYVSDNLRHLPFYNESLISIASRANLEPLSSWMPQAKPFIHHFAGNCKHEMH
jgi:glycosyltransferase involved in cell wall biosynthesis